MAIQARNRARPLPRGNGERSVQRGALTPAHQGRSPKRRPHGPAPWHQPCRGARRWHPATCGTPTAARSGAGSSD